MNTIKVEITESCSWYNKGEVYEVYNKIYFVRNKPVFKKDYTVTGSIFFEHCKIRPLIPELTMDELFEKLGYIFKIKQ